MYLVTRVAAVADKPSQTAVFGNDAAKLRLAFVAAVCDARAIQYLKLFEPHLGNLINRFLESDLVRQAESVSAFVDDPDSFMIFVNYLRVEFCKQSLEISKLTEADELPWSEIRFKQDLKPLIHPMHSSHLEKRELLHIDSKLAYQIDKAIDERGELFYAKASQKWAVILEVTFQKLTQLAQSPRLQGLDERLGKSNLVLLSNALHANRFDIIPSLPTGFLWFHLDSTWNDDESINTNAHHLARYIKGLILGATGIGRKTGLDLAPAEITELAEMLKKVGAAFNQQFLTEHYDAQLEAFLTRLLSTSNGFKGSVPHYVRVVKEAYEKNRVHLYEIFQGLSRLEDQDIKNLNVAVVEESERYRFLNVLFNVVYEKHEQYRALSQRLQKYRQLLELSLAFLNPGSAWHNSGHDVPINFVSKVFLTTRLQYGFNQPPQKLEEGPGLDRAIGEFVKLSRYRVSPTLLRYESMELSQSWNFLVFMEFRNQIASFAERLKRNGQ